MTVRTTADIHFDEADVHHAWHPDVEHGAYGVLKFAWGANVYFQTTAQVHAVIAELVALKQEMAPPVITDSEPIARIAPPVIDARAPAPEGNWCPATTGPDDELDRALYCDRDAGHAGSHHAPGPDEGSEVAWSDEPAGVAS